MANKTQMEYTINVRAKTDQAINDIKALSNSLNNTFSSGTGNKELSNSLSTIDKLVTRLTDNLNKPVTKESTFTKMQEDANNTVLELNKIIQTLDNAEKASNTDKLSFVDKDAVNRIVAMRDAVIAYQKALEETVKNNNTIAAAQDKVTEANNKLIQAQNKQKSAEAYQKQQIALKEKYLAALNEQYELEKRLSDTSKPLNQQEKDRLEKLKADNTQFVTKLGYASTDTARTNNLSKLTSPAADKVAKAENATVNAREELDQLTASYQKLQTELIATNAKIKTDAWDKLKTTLTGLNLSMDNIQAGDLTAIGQLIDSEEVNNIDEANEKIAQYKTLVEKLIPLLEEMKGEISDNNDEAKKQTETLGQIEGIRSRVKQIVSLTGAIQLLTKATRSAFNTIQELDATMTETAVVTDFDVGDMWDQLDEYSEKANQLGLAINDVYKASTLYYQQGLTTQQVTALTTQTLKMARIAGLEAAEATDRMTAALRGFNMEINETNATNVADVYSKLAAITASDVDEISVAMTKVASLANSANMSFENTSAFLAQIIETTRESAETAGTALKTVVARFAEVKENIDATEDSEGEELSYNKIDAALKSVGISMDAFMKGQEGLDDVLMRLAQKWDTLDRVTQRYIATQAAGSRQQSRFIALMSDYKRTIELTTAATNAAGASATQFDKTIESLDFKLNKLQNAWDTLTMSFMNSEAIKVGIDLVTSLLTGINNLNDSLSGGTKAFAVFTELVVTLGLLDIAFKLLEKRILAIAKNFAISKTQAKAFNAELEKLSANQILSNSLFGKASKEIQAYIAKLKAGNAHLFSMTLTLTSLLGIIAAVIAAIIIVTKAIRTFKNLQPEAQLKTITETLNTLNEELSETQEELDSITTSLDNIQSAEDTLAALTVGTEAWQKQLESVNNSVANLISQYPDLARYFTLNANGAYVISEENRKALLNDYNAKIKQQSGAVSLVNIEKNRATMRNNIANTSAEYDTKTRLLAQDILENITADSKFDLKAALEDPNVLDKYASAVAKQNYLSDMDTTDEEATAFALEQAYTAILEHSDKIQTLINTNNNLVSANNVLLKNYLESNIPKVTQGNEGYVSEKVRATMAQDTTDYADNLYGSVHGKKEAQKMLRNAKQDNGLIVTENNNGVYTAVTSAGKTVTYTRDQIEDLYNEWARFENAKQTLGISETANEVDDQATAIKNEFVNAFNSTEVKDTIASAYLEQIAKLETGAISELDFSGINYKDILAMNPDAFTNEIIKNAAAAEKTRWTSANNLAMPAVSSLNYDATQEQDLITRLHNAQGIFDSGDTEAIAKALAKSFTQAEIATLGVTDEEMKRALEIQYATNKTNNDKIKDAGYNTAIDEASNNVLVKNEVTGKTQSALLDTIEKLNPQLKDNDTLLKAIAASSVKTSVNLTSLNEAYSDNEDVINAANKTSADYWSALTTLASKFNNILGTSIDSQFIDEHLGYLQDALNGDTDAFLTLIKTAAEADLKNLGLTPENQKILEEAAKNTVSGYEQTAGTTLTGGIFEELSKLLSGGAITDTIARTIGRQYGAELTENGWQAIGGAGLISGMSSALVGQSIDYLKGQYNSLFKIEQLQEELNNAQTTYNRLLNDTNSSFAERTQLLKDEQDYNAAMAAEYGSLATKQADAIKKFLANDTSGNFSFDFTTGFATISENAGPEDREEFEEIVKTYKEYASKQNSYLKTISDNNKKYNESYLSLVEDAASMLQEEDEAKIDLLQKQLDAEKDAAENLLNAIENNFTQLRKDRENEDKEEDITSLTRRLAYLRQDTSGSNALQIKELEEELDSQLQDYSDDLIDQSLDTLSDQQDAAFEQRQQQIDNQSSIITWMKDYGEYNEEATELIKDTLDTLQDETLTISDTDLATLITNTNKNLTEEQLEEKLNGYVEKLDEAELFDYTANAEAFNSKFPALVEKPIPVKVEETPAKTPSEEDPNKGKDNQTPSTSSNYNYQTTFNNQTYTASTLTELEEIIEDAFNEQYKGWFNRKTQHYLVDSAIKKAVRVKYASGGLNTTTGPAWLDGTKANPELVLNAQDTQNFLQLRDILRNWLGSSSDSSVTTGNYMFDVDINVDQLASDYDVATLAEQVENKIVSAMSYRNNTLVSRTK